MKSALLLSGGMDSLALAYWKRPDLALTVDYGQLAAEAEITASEQVCNALSIEHHILRVDCRTLGSGDMAGTSEDALAPASDWWPYRNQLLLTLVAMKAVAMGVTRLWIGTVKSDGGHRDGTAEFVDLIDKLLSYQEGGLRIEAPAIHLSTGDLIRETNVPRSLLAWSHSCHKANVACGQCRGCNKHIEVYQELDHGMDPVG